MVYNLINLMFDGMTLYDFQRKMENVSKFLFSDKMRLFSFDALIKVEIELEK